MTLNDKEAPDFYDNPENQVAAGRGRTLPDRPLSTHVPVRFSPETVSLVKYFAAIDGLTLSSWIRREVEKAIQRRMPRPRTGFLYLALASQLSNTVSNPNDSMSSPGVGKDADLNREVSCGV